MIHTKTDLIPKLNPQSKPKSVDNCGYSQVYKSVPVVKIPENPIKSRFSLWITMWIVWISRGNSVIYAC